MKIYIVFFRMLLFKITLINNDQGSFGGFYVGITKVSVIEFNLPYCNLKYSKI